MKKRHDSRGRPRDGDDGRYEVLQIRLTAKEKERIRAYATLHGITMAESLRRLLDGAEDAEGLRPNGVEHDAD